VSVELLSSIAGVAVALAAMVFTTVLLARQVRQMEHERNALAVLEAIERLTDPLIVDLFQRLRGINERFAEDSDVVNNYHGSQDAADIGVVGQFVETMATLARRRVIDPSLLVDAMGLSIRRWWDTIRVFILRRRRIEHNDFILENFEWLAMYSAWWKDTPRPKGDANYDPDQFKGVTFHV